jgi:colanic acid biosynthesis glycosyl transferase WcaI
MKVVFVNRFFWPDLSATSQMLTDLARFFAAQGLQVRIVTSRMQHERPEVRLAPESDVDGIQVHRIWTTRFGRRTLPGRFMDYITFYAAALFALLQILKRGDIVIAKTDPPLISIVAMIAARAKRATLMNWLQDIFPEAAERMGIRVAGGPLGTLLRGLRDHSLRFAVANVALGERMAEFVEVRAPGSVVVIPNWADGDLIRPIAPNDNPLRREWHLDDRFVVGYSGNMGRAHDLLPLLAAAERLSAQESIAFLFIGEGRQLASLMEHCSTRHLRNVHFRPFQPMETLPMSLTVPDAHFVSLNPALEGLIVPSKFYSAIAAGRPVIFCGDPDGDVARALQDGADCGIVVAPDGLAIAGAIATLSEDVEGARQMGMRARALFERRFARSIALEKWLGLVSARGARTSSRQPRA